MAIYSPGLFPPEQSAGYYPPAPATSQSLLQRLTNPNFLRALSGFASGNTVGDQFANVNNIIAGQQQKTEATAADAALRNKTVAELQANAPELANQVAAGALSPNDAIGLYWKQKQQAIEDAKPKYQVINGKLVQTNAPGGIKVAGDFSDPEANIPADAKANKYWITHPDEWTAYQQRQRELKPASLMNLGKGLIYDPINGKYITPPPGTADNETEYGVTPVWFVDKDGNKRLGLPGKNGTLKLLDNPDGMTPLPGVNNLDTGTSFQTQDKKTGQIISSMPKDVEGKQAAIDRGKALTAAQVQLSGARQTAQMVQDGVQSIVNDPALDQALGPLDSRLPTWRTSTAGVEAKINQVKGQVFMQARQLLKGGGQITDFEGRKAEDAYARLSTAQSKEDFTKALTDFNSAVQEGLKKLEAQAKGNFDFDPNASQTPAKPVTAINPQTGERITLQNGQWVPAQ